MVKLVGVCVRALRKETNWPFGHSRLAPLLGLPLFDGVSEQESRRMASRLEAFDNGRL